MKKNFILRYNDFGIYPTVYVDAVFSDLKEDGELFLFENSPFKFVCFSSSMFNASSVKDTKMYKLPEFTKIKVAHKHDKEIRSIADAMMQHLGSRYNRENAYDIIAYAVINELNTTELNELAAWSCYTFKSEQFVRTYMQAKTEDKRKELSENLDLLKSAWIKAYDKAIEENKNYDRFTKLPGIIKPLYPTI